MLTYLAVFVDSRAHEMNFLLVVAAQHSLLVVDGKDRESVPAGHVSHAHGLRETASETVVAFTFPVQGR